MTKPAILLLVEDDSLVREVLNEELIDAGFEVVLADDGDHALMELNSHGGRFRAVVSDIRLGKGPDGWTVGRRARELVPHIAIIYISGDSGHDWVSKGVPNSLVLFKPFVPAQLITAIATLLNKAATHGKVGP